MNINYFNIDGSLTPEGENLLVRFKGAIDMLFHTDELQGLTEAELGFLETHMIKMITDRFSRRFTFKQNNANEFAEWSDEQFYSYLKEKYGELWQFMSLTEEELARCPRLSEEEIFQAIEQGIKDQRAAMEAY